MNSPLRLLSSTSCALLALTVLSGCPDKGPGELTVTYVLGNDKTCEEVGVDSVRAKLTIEGTERYSEDVDCSVGEIVIDEIEPELYDVEVLAYDDAGVAILDNLGNPLSERRVEIFEASSASHEAELDARPSVLKVRWRLGDEGFGNCASVGIDRFVVKAFEVGGSALLLEDTIDCEEGGDPMGYREVPDPERLLNGTLFGEVGIQAQDASGADVGAAATFVCDPVGAGYPVELTIECSDVECTGSGTVDP
jgi:hypothetical protein